MLKRAAPGGDERRPKDNGSDAVALQLALRSGCTARSAEGRLLPTLRMALRSRQLAMCRVRATRFKCAEEKGRRSLAGGTVSLYRRAGRAGWAISTRCLQEA